MPTPHNPEPTEEPIQESVQGKRGVGGLPAYPRQTEPGYYGPWQYGPNGLAVWSFILGLVGAVPFGLVLGGIALGKIRDTGQSGKWLAIGGIALSVLWIPIAVLALAANH